jgi:hypothetical protein
MTIIGIGREPYLLLLTDGKRHKQKDEKEMVSDHQRKVGRPRTIRQKVLHQEARRVAQHINNQLHDNHRPHRSCPGDRQSEFWFG